MTQKESKQKRRDRGEKDIQIWLSAETVEALGYLKEQNPTKNQTQLINEAIRTFAYGLPDGTGAKAGEDGQLDDIPRSRLGEIEDRIRTLEGSTSIDEEAREQLNKLERRIEQLEAGGWVE